MLSKETIPPPFQLMLLVRAFSACGEKTQASFQSNNGAFCALKFFLLSSHNDNKTTDTNKGKGFWLMEIGVWAL